MKNIFIINTHEYYPVSEGKLNASLVDKAQSILESKGYEVQVTTMKDDYDPIAEVEKHVWADAVILQIPVNWMGVPWSFKKYIDTVYSSGLEGQLCHGDGRTRSDANQQYGTGGVLQDKKYMLSLTFNAPKDAFDNADQWFFEGKGVDDLFWTTHLNFKFFGMKSLETFVCYDVMKNPNIDNDFKRFESHLNQYF
ncbi:NAD(P)H-dependent oxidoreductase [Candidatus Albibeggiatoa sp. nov. BB20]|uniref:NAD(P)H-dependent oxidoreductase n=1 Tax=Candidatus Albibeggiatoa sp. nov. BB20 TaxID=3162723 RepID=UPI0033653D7C